MRMAKRSSRPSSTWQRRPHGYLWKRARTDKCDRQDGGQPRRSERPGVEGPDRYAEDTSVPGLLDGRLALSNESPARVRRIDAQQALAIPGVVAVLTAAELPIATRGNDRMHEPLAREEVVFAGQPIALVVAETE